MKFKLLEIEIKGFKSFEKKCNFIFDDNCGVYFITGKNKIDSELETNGVGKTSLLDAICWVFTEKGIDGLTSSNLKTWNSQSEMFVKVVFRKENERIILTRQYKPNSLILQTETETKNISQEELENFVDFNIDIFKNLIFLSQKSIQFFEMSPSEKSKLFYNILYKENIIYDELEEKISLQSTITECKLNEYKATIENLNGQLISLQKIDYDSLIKKWEDDNKNNIQEYIEKKKKCEDEIINLKENLPSIIEDKKSMEKIINENKIEKQTIEKDMSDITYTSHVELKVKTNSIQNKINELLKEERHYQELLQKKICPLCNQEMKNMEEIEKTIGEINVEIVQKKEEIKKLKIEQEENEKIILKKKTKIKVLEDTITDNRNILKKIETKIIENEMNIKTIKKNIAEIENILCKDKNIINPYLEQKENIILKIKTIEKENNEITKKYNDELCIFDIYKYWQKTGIKKLKLEMILEVLKEMEFITNQQLQKLGLDNWKIFYEIDRETKTGNIKSELNIFIVSPYNNEKINFDCFSGGERSRLCLSGTLALKKIIQTRYNLDWNIEFWDEPLKFLSSKGVEEFLTILSERAIEENKQIYLIEHRNLENNGVFIKTITIIKDSVGSYFE